MIPEDDPQVVNSFIKSFSKYIAYLEKEMADDSFNFNEIRIILELLEKERMPAKEIETELDLDKGYTSRILKRLLDDNIIQREQSDDDKRLFYLSFTTEGKKLAKKLAGKYQQLINHDYEDISDEEREAFSKALNVIQKKYSNKIEDNEDSLED